MKLQNNIATRHPARLRAQLHTSLPVGSPPQSALLERFCATGPWSQPKSETCVGHGKSGATDVTASAASDGAPPAEGGDAAAAAGGKRCRRFIPFSDGVRSCYIHSSARAPFSQRYACNSLRDTCKESQVALGTRALLQAQTMKLVVSKCNIRSLSPCIPHTAHAG